MRFRTLFAVVFLLPVPSVVTAQTLLCDGSSMLQSTGTMKRVEYTIEVFDDHIILGQEGRQTRLDEAEELEAEHRRFVGRSLLGADITARLGPLGVFSLSGDLGGINAGALDMQGTCRSAI